MSWPPKAPLQRRGLRERGAAMVEFVMVAPLITVLGFGVLQYSLMFFAKNQINHATFMAARAGTVAHADVSAMHQAYLRALIPLYGGGRNSAELTRSLTRARCDMEQGDPECLAAPGVMMRLEVLNPTRESFEDFAKDDQLNQQFGSDTLAIPNTGLALRPDLNTVGSASGQSLADANLLKIRITHGYQPKVWLMAMFYKKYLQWLDKGDDEFHTALIDAGRLPIVSHATLLMQSEALMRGQADEGPYASNPGQGNQGQPKDPGDAAVNDRDPPRCFTMGCSVSIDDPTGLGGGDSGGGTDGSGNHFGGGSGGFCPVT